VWLLLAAGFNAVTFRFPFYSGDWIHDKFLSVVDLNAQTTIWHTLLTVITGALAVITIFLFTKRKMQLKLCYLGILLTIALLALYFLEINNFIGGTISIWAIFYFAILLCFIFAARGIKQDEKLIRSMDRFR
jgi:hypothetical protein